MPTLDDVFDELHALLREEGRPVATAPELAERLDQSRRKTLDDLRLLERAGDVESFEAGARSLVWWPTDLLATTPGAAADAQRTGPPGGVGELVEAGAERSDEATGDTSAATADGRASAQEMSDAGEEQPFADLDFPQGRDHEACVAAIMAARDHLRDHGPAPMREIVAEVMPEHTLGYDVPDLESGSRYRGSWWRRIVKPGLQALDDVEAPGQSGQDWRYVGDD